MRKLFTLLTVVLMALSVKAGEVTVADGTATNDNLPIYGFYADTGFKTQFIYPAASLANIEGSTMNALLFYSSYESVVFPDGEVTVKLAEVAQTTLSAILDDASFTKVYQGSFDVVNNQLVFEFSEPYAYEGGNLLVQVELTKKSSKYPYTSFYGISSTGSGYLQTNIDVARNFLPKSTISFTSGGGGATCPKPSQLAAAATPDGAVFTWEGENEQYQWCVVEKDAEAAGWALVEAKTYTASGLTAGKEYDFYVRTYCDAESQSKEAKISFSPVCNAPANIEMSDLTHESVSFSWAAVAGIEKYQYLCVLKDTTPNWEGVEAKAGLSVSVDTLHAQTSYDFYVRSWFNAETQSDAVKVAFTTNCVARTLPFSENFDDAAELPICWDATNYGTSGNQWGIGSTWDEFKSEPNSARYNARSSSYTPSDLSTPAVELSENALLKFAYKNAITAEVYIHDGSKETKLLDVPSKSSWTEETIDLSDYTGKIVTFIFRGHANNKSQYFYVDDVQIVAKPCVTPTKVKADASSTGAVVTWTAGSDESEWNLRYKAVEGTEWKEVKALAENTYTITGLVSDTEYEVQVQAACTAEKLSEWSASALFTPHCPVPTELAVKIVEENSAVVAWESTESAFNLQYKAADAAEWTSVKSIEAKSYELTGLEASTAYQVIVQTACGSAYTDAVSFTTRCAPLADAIPYVLHMDSVAVGSMPECWFVLPRTAVVEVALMNDDSHRLLIEGEQECWVVLPALNANLNALTVTVNWSGSALKEIGYLTAADPETFVSLATFSGSPAECDLRTATEDAKYVAFHYLGTSASSIGYIAQVQITESQETAIENTTASAKATKRIENGMLVLEYNGTIFDATGRKMN